MFNCESADCEDWPKRATRDPLEIAVLFSMQGAALIGTPTGQDNGFDVLDIDSPHGHNWLRANIDVIPQTQIVKTRTNGLCR
jgi:hypothetical protein